MKYLYIILFLPILIFVGCDDKTEWLPLGVGTTYRSPDFFMADQDTLDVDADAHEFELYVHHIINKDSIINGWKIYEKFVYEDDYIRLGTKSETSWVDAAKASDKKQQDVLVIKISENHTSQQRAINLIVEKPYKNSAIDISIGQLIIRQQPASND